MGKVQVLETSMEGSNHSNIIKRFDEFLDTVVVSWREAEEANLLE
jgi:hypothetical protein